MVRWVGRLAWVGGLGVAGAAVAWACLPNLTPDLCGNGIIDVAAGETCDPGANPSEYVGCNAVCQVACAPVTDGGASHYDSPFSNHCYLTFRKSEDNGAGAGTCGRLGGHMVTFVDDTEVELVNDFASHWPENPRYWVGLQSATPQDASPSAPPYFTPGSVEPFEPGWRSRGDCSGCFLHGTARNALPTIDGGPEAGPSNFVVATDLQNAEGTMAVMGGNARAQVVCEREPPGSRSSPCLNGSFCFKVLASPKSYVFMPSPLPAESAEAACRALSDAGTPTLVVFDTRAEREQVVYELTQLPAAFQGVDTPEQFWIGLSVGVVPTDAGADAGGGWIWDDHTSASPFSASSRPLVWGDHEPSVVPAPARAYIQLLQDTHYDNGLARAAAEAAGTALPFVCQY
jgi:hypothetical protein